VNLIHQIIKKSNSKNIIIGILFILFINLIVFPFFLTSTTNLKTILDLRFGFSINDVINSLSIMQKNGRERYLLTTLFIDTPYALIYGFIYAFIIVALRRNIPANRLGYIIIIPLLISLFDIIENSGIVYFILRYPNINSKIVTIISISNQLKWIAASLTFMLIIYLLLNKLITKSASNKKYV